MPRLCNVIFVDRPGCPAYADSVGGFGDAIQKIPAGSEVSVYILSTFFCLVCFNASATILDAMPGAPVLSVLVPPNGTIFNLDGVNVRRQLDHLADDN
jgi:hypothetical protein